MSSSTNARCSICNNPLDPKDGLVTTACSHTYHRTCAEDRRDNRRKTSCRDCDKESTLSEALEQDKIKAVALCSICGNSLNLKDNLEIAACAHESHRTCVDSRPNARHRSDCRVCQKDSTCDETLDRDKMSTRNTATEQSYSNQLESVKYMEKVTTTEGSETTEKKENSWECQACSVKQEETSTRCSSCGQAQYRIPDSDPLVKDTAVTGEEKCKQAASSITNQEDYVQKTSKSIVKTHPTLDSSPSDTTGSISDEMSSSSSEKKSIKLKQKQRSKETLNASSSIDAQRSCPEKKSRVETTISTSPMQLQSSPEYETIVYISNLPLEVEDNTQLENTIRHRLSIVLNIEPIDIKCYSNFGIGYLRVKNSQVKEHLVNTVGRIAWDSKPESVMISFRDTIELVSYIVFDRIDENKEVDYPKSDEIIRQWMNYYNEKIPPVCDQLNIQYPNIYRIISKSLNKLLHIALKPEFMMKNQLTQVYPCADCHYFEDLPISTTENQLRDMIYKTIGSHKISSSSSLYIQLNKPMKNACIITTGTTRKWIEKDSLYLDNQFKRKRKALSYRLLLHPVRHKDEIDTIIHHQIFNGKAKNLNYFGQNLILKIYDKNIYENCLKSKTLHISRDLNLSMTMYTGIPNSDVKEIDVDTWYEKEMLQSHPDITLFIQHPKHKIFHLKWNSFIWIEQFQRINKLQKSELRNNNDQQNQDKIRHLLRVTVMLNTLAVIRNKIYTINDRDIPLNLNNKLKTIVYNHQSKLEHSGSIPIKKTPYKITEVKVINEDCLVIYENLVNQGKKPLLLNMANATIPGGGYRKGAGAQEENLFRRSDYCRSLDFDLDKFENPSARFYCTSTCNMKRIDDSNMIYPMDEYGAIYTSGLTVFRQTELEGYEFMEKPLTNVCSLAIAAYRHPPLDGNNLSLKYAIGMRKKIENIFNIAYYNQHDSLVLSAFGCGAFQNPPEHVAKIFRSVIEQYAGFFQLIVFAIIDDHNTGFHLNPKGNFLPFQYEFKQSIFESIQPINQPNTIFGPYRFLSNDLTVDNVSICDLRPCQFGSKCHDIHNLTHTRQYSHPPLCTEICITGKCTKINDIVHICSFIHPNICLPAGLSPDIDDRKHVREYEHPSYCQYGRYCPYFHDRQHMKDHQHPFPQPCPWTPYHCILYDEFTQSLDRDKLSNHIKQHCLDFAHVCYFGRNCLEQNSLHWKTTIHIPRFICNLGKECLKLDQDNHFNSLTHINIQDIRYLCQNGSTCSKFNQIEHKAQYRHDLIIENNSIIPFCDLNKNINFIQNQQNIIECIMNYLKNEERISFKLDSIPENIINWIRTIQPIYQCNSQLFELFLFQEYIMSYQYIEHLKNPKFLTNCIIQHKQIQSNEKFKSDQCKQHLKNYITGLINKTDQQEKTSLLKYISQDDINLIHQITKELIQLIINFHENYLIDMNSETNRHILSFLGTYLNNNNDDIIIIFKREILHHLDSNFSIDTSESYLKGKFYKSQPWFQINSNSINERIKLFHQTKYHASMPGYEKAVALQLLALINHNSHKQIMNINLQDLITNSSKNLIEARLPQIISFDYIDQIYMTKNIYNSFNDNIRRRIKTIFGHRLIIPSTKSNEEYYHYITDTLIEQYNKYNIEYLQGFVLTIPSTNFSDNLVLPLKISQAYEYYLIHHSKSSIDTIIYIYWQVNNGDMMLTLSNEQINCDQLESKIPCLICYIARKPLININQYKENPSYLKLGEILVKSTSFYLGCNLDNLMTYCLEIHPSNGMVKLSNVGSNSIYNHEIISYKFNKSDIDLSKLEYIHVSAGNHNVSIRNLSVTFKKQNDLHPEIDFKIEKNSTNDIQMNKNSSSYGIIDQEKNKSLQIVDQKIDYLVGKKTSPLIPCSYGINCLTQFSDNGVTHNSKYSHPCRFAELCRNPESHLTHELHRATLCSLDQKCKLLGDPHHRAKYRHSGLPYFLIPCRYQSKCRDNTEKHRMKYSHGEHVLKTMVKLSSEYDDQIQRTSCKWGATCRDIKDPQHCSKYSHSVASIQKEENNRSLRRSNSEYSDYDINHRSEYKYS